MSGISLLKGHPSDHMNETTIRILHTADWHLGREFHGRDLTSLHQHFFDWLAGEVERREIDVLVMAGDIYDRALPPVGAVSMLNRELNRLADLTRLVLITGNHDSTARMGHGSLLRKEIELRAGIERLGEPVMIDDFEFALAIYPIPYLDPVTSANELDLDESTHQSVLTEAADRCRSDLASRGETRSIAIGHAFVTGAEVSDSERSVRVGGSESVAVPVFEGFDYVALGHLHRPQRVGANARYAGSPLPLSYSEVGVGEPKSVTVVELSADGTLTDQQVEIPQQVQMARVSGTLEELLNDPDLEDKRDWWLEITLTDELRPSEPKDRLRSRFSNIVQLRLTAPVSSGPGIPPEELERLARSDPSELVAAFLKEVRGAGPSVEEAALIEEALEEKTAEEVNS
ncbi:MAG: exonuclease SbcCD subunit D C-terminal domain-containing protein [Solirubrobacterales bacterium]|nr:exonuclease SbcCD subunit D C-terminal domain-containing protein [Solirubrobacterales bacterium]